MSFLVFYYYLFLFLSFSSLFRCTLAAGLLFLIECAGFKTYADNTGTRIVSHGVFAMPFLTHELAWALLRASHAPAVWDQFTFLAESPVFVRSNAYVQRLSYSDLQDGNLPLLLLFLLLSALYNGKLVINFF